MLSLVPWQNFHSFTGSLWCESRAGNSNKCAGKDKEECGEGEGCVYCESAAVGNQCYTTVSS